MPQLINADVIKIVVIIDEAEVRWHPDLKSIVIKTIPKGTVLESKERIGDWFKVEIPPSEMGIVSGYIHSSAVETVVEKPEEEKPVTQPERQISQQEIPPSPPSSPPLAKAANFFIEIKGTYFYPSDKDFQNIYGAGLKYGGNVVVYVWKKLGIWIGGSYFHKNGKLTYTKEDTELLLIPVVLGLRYRLMSNAINAYVGLGVNYVLYNESSIIGEVNTGKIGVNGNLGAYLNFWKGLFINVFIQLSYCKMYSPDFSINLGGIEAGIGLGYEF